jgi:hypothetical protein
MSTEAYERITVPCESIENTQSLATSTNSNVVEEYPKGYPLLAAFQSSESSFSIYRSFDYLHSRVILKMQDELCVLERGLKRLEDTDLMNGASKCITSRDSDIMRAKKEGKPSKRESLLSDISDKLVRYDDVLLKARELNGFQRPSKRDYLSLRHWFNNERPLSYAREKEYIMKREDLITLRQGREWASFDGWVESSIQRLPRRLSTVSDSCIEKASKCLKHLVALHYTRDARQNQQQRNTLLLAIPS